MGNRSSAEVDLQPRVAITNQHLVEVPEGLIHRKITNLDLSFNRLVDLPLKVGEIEALKFLKLQGNRLEEIPKAVLKSKLATLEFLALDRNCLKRLSPQISLLHNLTQLALSRNQV